LDYKTVSKMTAAQLRDELSKDPDVTGVTSMKKDKLVEIYCEKHGIERHAHADLAIDKTAIKQAIRSLKKERDTALADRDPKKLAEVRHAIHKQRHLLRKAVEQAELAARRG
jgi:hypothetical protein